MNKLYFQSKQILRAFNDNSEIISFIYQIQELKKEYLIKPEEITSLSRDSTSCYTYVYDLKSKIELTDSKSLTIVKTIRPNKVYKLTNQFISDLNLFDNSFNDNNKLIKEIKLFPEIHTDAYSERETKYFFSLVENAKALTELLNEYSDRSDFIIREYEKNSKKSPKDYQKIRIRTDQDIPLIADFINIFKSIEGLYNFISHIHKIDTEKKPLILNNISTGSWYSELLGIKQVVISLENLLKGIGTFIRDYITGKIDREKFENECLKAEAFIKLIKVAEENGIDNAHLGIFKKLTPLIDNFKNETTTILEINEEEVLKLQELEKITLLQQKNNREKLIDKIDLIENKSTKKNK